MTLTPIFALNILTYFLQFTVSLVQTVWRNEYTVDKIPISLDCVFFKGIVLLINHATSNSLKNIGSYVNRVGHKEIRYTDIRTLARGALQRKSKGGEY